MLDVNFISWINDRYQVIYIKSYSKDTSVYLNMQLMQVQLIRFSLHSSADLHNKSSYEQDEHKNMYRIIITAFSDNKSNKLTVLHSSP